MTSNPWLAQAAKTRLVHLKIKIASLVAEARIIRSAEHPVVL